MLSSLNYNYQRVYSGFAYRSIHNISSVLFPGFLLWCQSTNETNWKNHSWLHNVRAQLELSLISSGLHNKQLVLLSIQPSSWPLPQSLIVFSLITPLQDHIYLPLLRRKRLHALRFITNNFHMKPLKLSITLSPYTSINSPIFQRSLQEGKEEFWLSRHSESGDYSVQFANVVPFTWPIAFSGHFYHRIIWPLDLF